MVIEPARTDRNYFLNNRERFFGKLEENTITVLFSGTAKRKSADQYFPFFANRNFFYLTGIEQEGSVLLIKKQSGKILRMILFIRAYDEYAEKWYGKRLTKDEAGMISGIYDISFSEGLDAVLKTMLDGWDGSISLDRDSISDSDVWLLHVLEDNYPQIEITNVFPVFSKLRMIKSDYEIELIKKAIDITDVAIRKIYETARVGMAEYELAAEFSGVLARNGFGAPSFDSIVATGDNFKYLHYPQLGSVIKSGDMLLLDVGAVCNGLCSDISRAFPIDGRFSPRQLEIYNIVLTCQKKAFSMIKPGVFIKDINASCKKIAADMLIDLKILYNSEDVDRYYWHNVSHHLGLDVHDICSRDVVLEKGMVITVEPGVYVPEYGVGLRIEDDVLVTEDGCEVLSKDIVREPAEIEALVMSHRAKYEK